MNKIFRSQGPCYKEIPMYVKSCILSVESQKGINTTQCYSIRNLEVWCQTSSHTRMSSLLVLRLRACMCILHKAKKKKLLCCPLPTDRKMRKNRVVFFFFLCQIWAKNLLKFVFNGLKKHLHDLYMRFDCIPPEFSPFRNFKKILENSTLSRYVKKKKKKKIPTDRPNF